MARNQEKAQSMLHRYLRSKGGDGVRGIVGGVYEKRRPYLATLCNDADEAEKWHRQVESEIRRHVDEIQNPGLDEGRVRDINDRINKLLRERRHWRRRIGELGGSVPSRADVRVDGGGDDQVFEYDGYMYFGAARNLPGVRDMIEARRKLFRGDDENNEDCEFSHKHIDSMTAMADDFYFRGIDDDPALDKELERAEAELSEILAKDWTSQHKDDEKYRVRYGEDAPWDNSYLQSVGRRVDEDDAGRVIEDVALERKKLEALDEFGGDDLATR